MSKEELREFTWIMKNIAYMEERLAILECSLTKISSSLKEDVVDYTPQKDKMSGQIADIIEIQKKINEKLMRARVLENKIEDVIERLPEREKLLIRLKYINGLTWEEVAVEMNYSWQHIHRVHSKALKMVKK